MVIQKTFRRQHHGDKCTHNVTGDEYILIIMSFASIRIPLYSITLQLCVRSYIKMLQIFFSSSSKLINNSKYQLIIHLIKLRKRKWCWWVYYYLHCCHNRFRFNFTYFPTFSLRIGTFLQSSNQKLLLLWLCDSNISISTLLHTPVHFAINHYVATIHI